MNTCKYCGKSFAQMKTLSTHVCVKKQRFLDVESAGSRLGLRTFQRFYELTTACKKVKSVEDFINSPYYIDFAKFGNHLAMLKPVYIEKYIDFVILNGVKLQDWSKDFVYETYINDLVKKEPAESATDRTITEIMEWADKNNEPFNEFFSRINVNEAAYLIKTGRISPWVLYLSGKGDDLLSRFNADHSKMIGEIIDPGSWMRKFKKSEEDVDYIRSLLEEANL
jgi:hypothetical protein